MNLDVILVLLLDEDFGLTLINIDKPWMTFINLKLAHGVDSELQNILSTLYGVTPKMSEMKKLVWSY